MTAMTGCGVQTVGTISTAHEEGALEQTVEWFGLKRGGVYKSTVVDRENEPYLRGPRDRKIGRRQEAVKGRLGLTRGRDRVKVRSIADYTSGQN